MSEVDPRVMEQMTRMHHAVTAGTVDIDTIRDALARLYDLLSGKADEGVVSDGGEGDPNVSFSPTAAEPDPLGDGEEYEQEGEEYTTHSGKRGRRGKRG